jgi:hypothetical protein
MYLNTGKNAANTFEKLEDEEIYYEEPDLLGLKF